MCMYVANEGGNNNARSNGMEFEHCGKNGHTAYKDGKPFCFALIAALKGNPNPNTNKSNNNGVKFKGKCHNLIAALRGNPNPNTNRSNNNGVKFKGKCRNC